MTDLVLHKIAQLPAPTNRGDLIRARHAIHHHVELQQLFEQAEAEQWDGTRLATALEWDLSILGTDVEQSVCRYLAEEFIARDKTSTLLVEADTGLAIAQVPEDAIYVPEPVAREGSDHLAVPLPRLKPEIAAAIVQHRNGVAEEQVVIGKLQTRARSSVLQRAEGDQRLHIATRTGRKALGERVREELPNLLKDHAGAIGRLFARFRINESVPTSCSVHTTLTLRKHTSMLVADALAMNLQHDPFRATCDKIRTGWGRDLAKAVAAAAPRNMLREVTVKDHFPAGLLIGPPDLARMAPHLKVLAFPDVRETLLMGDGYLWVKSYEFDAYEADARWCVDAAVQVVLHLDVALIRPLKFTDLIEADPIVEVV